MHTQTHTHIYTDSHTDKLKRKYNPSMPSWRCNKRIQLDLTPRLRELFFTQKNNHKRNYYIIHKFLFNNRLLLSPILSETRSIQRTQTPSHLWPLTCDVDPMTRSRMLKLSNIMLCFDKCNYLFFVKPCPYLSEKLNIQIMS